MTGRGSKCVQERGKSMMRHCQGGSVREEAPEKESAWGSMRGEACLQRGGSMRGTEMLGGGEPESGEAHEREVNMCKEGKDVHKRWEEPAHERDGEHPHVRGGEIPDMRDVGSAQGGEASVRGWESERERNSFGRVEDRCIARQRHRERDNDSKKEA